MVLENRFRNSGSWWLNLDGKGSGIMYYYIINEQWLEAKLVVPYPSNPSETYGNIPWTDIYIKNIRLALDIHNYSVARDSHSVPLLRYNHYTRWQVKYSTTVPKVTLLSDPLPRFIISTSQGLTLGHANTQGPSYPTITVGPTLAHICQICILHVFPLDN